MDSTTHPLSAGGTDDPADLLGRTREIAARAGDVATDVGTRIGTELGAELGKEVRESALLLALALVVVGLVALLGSTALLLG